MRARDRGFTLLEMVVVLAIFAMVALVGVQVIRSAVMTDRRLSEISDQSRELAVALALLRRDLGAGIGLPFYPVTGGVEPALKIEPRGFSLSVSGMAGIGASQAGLGRVIWRLDPGRGQLLRRVWMTLEPGGAQAAGPEVAVLIGVTDFGIESFGFPGGWQLGFTADPRTPNVLPRGLRVRMDHRRYDRLETIVALP